MDEFFHITPQIFEDNYRAAKSLTEIGEETSPKTALLFKGGVVTVISGKSSALHNKGFVPFTESRFNTEHALNITKAMATLHATSIVEFLRRDKEVTRQVESEISSATSVEYLGGCPKIESNRKGSFSSFIYSPTNETEAEITHPDPLTTLISRPQILEANLSILVDSLKHEGINPRVIERLNALKSDVQTLTQFLQFASAMQSSTSFPSVGPVSMCDVWVPKVVEDQEDCIIIRCRGGPSLRAPPLRDMAWIWLTLLEGNVLTSRYMELCETYCSAFNDSIGRLNSKHAVEDLSLLDVMRDLGENFLHGFLTIVHKFVVSGTWTLDRKLYCREGLLALSDSISFLVDNGIVGPIFIS